MANGEMRNFESNPRSFLGRFHGRVTVTWEDAARQKGSGRVEGLWSLETADVTAPCASGSNPGRQRRASRRSSTEESVN